MWDEDYQGRLQGSFVQPAAARAFNLVRPMSAAETDKTMSPSDAEPSETEAAAGDPARRATSGRGSSG
jgi:hypothetical protein